MARPDALGTDFQIKDIETADKALAELSWLRNQLDIVASKTKQKVDSIKTELAPLCLVEIEGQSVQISDRIEILEAALEKFTVKHIEKHLPEGRRSIDLAHGTLGLRKQPLTIAVSEKCKTDDVLELIDIASGGLVAKLRGFLVRAIKQLKSSLNQLVTVKITPNISAIKDAYTEQRLTADQVKGMGLVIREPFDAPVVNPAKCVTAAD